MSVYVDALMRHGWVLHGRATASCHMYADDVDELHAMAARIGMKRAWFQEHDRLPHYDLTPSRRALAVANGAVEQTGRQLVRFMRERALVKGAPDA